MISPVLPVIDADIEEVAPGFTALSILVKTAPEAHPEIAEKALADACAYAIAGGPEWGEAHLAAWDEAYRRFGAKPNRTPPSAKALLKRVKKDGGMPSINAVVDLYNAVSLRYAIPVGGEDWAAYQGLPHLTRAKGGEFFDVMKQGELAQDPPEAGEVVWRDDKGVTCRRWNWRQCVRTRLEPGAERCWFVLERLPKMPEEALLEAGRMLADGLREVMPGAEAAAVLAWPGGRTQPVEL